MSHYAHAALLATTFWVCAPHATVLQEMERELVALVEHVAPQVVTVQARFPHSIDGLGPGGMLNIGTGLLMDSLGYVLTSAAVVTHASVVAPTISVVDHRKRTHEAMLFGIDSTIRIAILYVPTMSMPSPLRLRAEEWKPGAFAIVVGNSSGISPSVSLTTVAGKRERDGFWQLSDPVTPGHSGAPVFDTHGAFGGIIVGEVADPSGNEPTRPFPAVMVSSEQLKAAVRRFIAATPKRGTPWLGIAVRPRVQGDGRLAIYVSDVIAGSPAAQAGLLPGDVLLGIDSLHIAYIADLANWIRTRRPGQRATVRILRQGQVRTITVTVGRR